MATGVGHLPLKNDGPHLRVASQFVDAPQQRAAATLGMWIFVATETLFFGTLFFAYAIARLRFPEAFAAASRHTNVVLGTLNTGILLTSSFFMALAVRSAALNARKASAALMVVTGTLGVTFAAVKLTEYAIDYREHLVPTVNFAFDPHYMPGALVFFGLYYTTTLVHLLHLTIGIALVYGYAWLAWRARPNVLADRVETVGLYWHFVDLVWIFLYPCLYLISRA